jgi:hypothetical protein
MSKQVIELQFEGRTYSWTRILDRRCDPPIWYWCCDETGQEPSADYQKRLNAEFVKTFFPGLIQQAFLSNASAFDLETDALFAILREMKGIPVQENAKHHSNVRQQETDLPFADITERPQEYRGSTFDFPIIRDWCCEGKTFQSDFLVFKAIGDGPYRLAEFGQFLKEKGAVVPWLDRSITCDLTSVRFLFVVLGRQNWIPDDIDGVIDLCCKVSRPLRMLSQEMAIAWLITGHDPFLSSKDVLDGFLDGHPALEYVSRGWPGWVSTEYTPGIRTAKKNLPPWHQTGMLGHYGYHVGDNGLPRSKRRDILKQVFLDVLPQLNNSEYVTSWGTPTSEQRLRKMAESIAAFCRNEKRKRHPSHEAISDWEEDLNWLKNELYGGSFRFQWPWTDM